MAIKAKPCNAQNVQALQLLLCYLFKRNQGGVLRPQDCASGLEIVAVLSQCPTYKVALRCNLSLSRQYPWYIQGQFMGTVKLVSVVHAGLSCHLASSSSCHLASSCSCHLASSCSPAALCS